MSKIPTMCLQLDKTRQKFFYAHPVHGKKFFFDPDVIRTRNLLIWSQTRYHCATESQSTQHLETDAKNILLLV